MLHMASEKFGVRSVYAPGVLAATPNAAIPLVWIVSITSSEARVFSRASADGYQQRGPAHFNGFSRNWWLEPEVGMQLETFAHAPERNEAVKCQLSRLIGGLLSLAKTGGRFDELVVVAAASTRRHLRGYLNTITRSAVTAELDEISDDRPETLCSALRSELPHVFA